MCTGRGALLLVVPEGDRPHFSVVQVDLDNALLPVRGTRFVWSVGTIQERTFVRGSGSPFPPPPFQLSPATPSANDL